MCSKLNKKKLPFIDVHIHQNLFILFIICLIIKTKITCSDTTPPRVVPACHSNVYIDAIWTFSDWVHAHPSLATFSSGIPRVLLTRSPPVHGSRGRWALHCLTDTHTNMQRCQLEPLRKGRGRGFSNPSRRAPLLKENNVLETVYDARILFQDRGNRPQHWHSMSGWQWRRPLRSACSGF